MTLNNIDLIGAISLVALYVSATLDESDFIKWAIITFFYVVAFCCLIYLKNKEVL